MEKVEKKTRGASVKMCGTNRKEIRNRTKNTENVSSFKAFFQNQNKFITGNFSVGLYIQSG